MITYVLKGGMKSKNIENLKYKVFERSIFQNVSPSVITIIPTKCTGTLLTFQQLSYNAFISPREGDFLNYVCAGEGRGGFTIYFAENLTLMLTICHRTNQQYSM